EGDSPKKRGPKPDQKPAKNDKIERNRKAQRSHRERKERYIRNLEQELQRLREAYTAAIKEKVTVREENKQLHAILKQNGIAFPYSSQGTVLGDQQITPEQYSRIAINLVLGLEKPCSDHMQKLATLSHQNSGYIQGHVLMVSCPPESHTTANPNQEWGLRTVDLDPEPLGTLFNMQVLDAERKRYLEGLDGELTPMAAWTKITTHPRFHELTIQDFDTLTEVLSKRVGCHGFGAVIEEAEVEVAMDSFFGAKDGRA
ncbi:hypothetical protein L211DRAFT_784308, partial [Terfezia boudieri ATCC MYA-4762]